MLPFSDARFAAPLRQHTRSCLVPAEARASEAVAGTPRLPRGWRLPWKPEPWLAPPAGSPSAPSSASSGRRRPAPVAGLRRTLLCLVGGSLPWATEAIYKVIDAPHQEALWTFLEYDIGLEPGAEVVLNLTNDKPTNNTYVMVLTHSQWVEWRQVEPTTLPSSAGDTGGLNSYLISYWRGALNVHLEAKFKISALTKDRYHVGVLNAQQQVMSLHGYVSMVNPGGRELPLQDEHVPYVLSFSSALFCGTCFVYSVYLYACMRRHNRTTMHLLISSAICLKGLVLLFWLVDELMVAKNGLTSSWSRVGWQLLEKIQTILELMMFLLIALGWKFLRADLNRTEVKFAVGISLVSFYLGVFEVACTSQATCGSYQLSRYILHSLCYLVVIVAMNFNMQVVYQQIADAPASLDSGKLYKKYHAFKGFRIIFLGFIIAPTVELFLQVTVMPWDAKWLFVLVTELRTWAIYVAIIMTFTALPHPTHLRVFDLTRDIAASDDEVDSEVAVTEQE